MRYACRAGVIAGSRVTVVAARLSARELRQQATRVTATRRGHEGTNMTAFICLASFRRRSAPNAPKQNGEVCVSGTRLSTILNVR